APYRLPRLRPMILPASSCSRIAAWVRCSCYSVGRPSPSLEWWLDGKLLSGSEDVSVSHVNLENATLRSSITMRAPAGPTALTCHSSNAAGNTSQELISSCGKSSFKTGSNLSLHLKVSSI
uniref:Ig-like domain-containing protein n=1 Tax=Gadus morhua TaxID=8049 RepID=A0A8C5C0B0_GADMO